MESGLEPSHAAVGSATQTAHAPATSVARSRHADFVTLTKPRLNSLIVVTTLATYFLGGGNELPWMQLVHTLIGTALVAAGASAFNQWWERDTDRLMRRTRLRPLADRRLHPQDGLWFAVLLTALGIADLTLGVNPLTAAVAVATLVSYVLLYTPLKLRTSLSTIVGAIPGALPAVIGWTAATNTLSIEGWVLFGIVFLWQMPHFLAIAWMFRDDYAAAGIPLLPVIQPDGRTTGHQAVLYTAGLIPVSFLPTAVGLASAYYLVGAMVLGAVLIVLSLEFATTRGMPAAKRLFFGTILYLPLLWAVLLADHFTYIA
ncbi:MAG: heme o synthase [Vicinamibacterales bacterium]